ncbi:hypothetical protein ACHAQF_001334 [Verticillium nonalfalfae]
MARPSLASPNITITCPSTPFAPSPLPPPNPLTHADEILAQFSKLTRSTSWRLVSKIAFEGELWEPEGIAKVGTDRYFVSAGEYTSPTRKFPDGQWKDGTDRTAGAGFGHIVVFDGQGQRIADATLTEKGSTEDCKFLGHAKAYEDRAVMLCSGIAKLADGVEVGGVAIVDAQTLEPLMEVPITMRTDHGVLVTKNPVDIDVVDGKMQLYFLPEEGHATLYVYEAV